MLLANMWFQNLMRTFFHGIDKVVFNLIPIVYNFLIDLARTSIVTQADIIDMADRIYKLLTVFMIFKVTFSLIMYVVNPDDFSDKSKGLSKLGFNIVISLSLLILTPYIFNYAYELQTYVLEDNALATLILGNKVGESSNSAFNTAGDTMAYIVMTPFFTPDSSLTGLTNCSRVTKKINDKEMFNPECSGITNDTYEPTGLNNTLYWYTADNKKENKAAKKNNFTAQTLKNYVAGVNNKNIGLTFRLDMATATVEDDDEEVFVMDYKYLASTAIGIVTLLLLISFCMDVALRSIKLAFLQLIAPIPIISYIDPKSGKDGLFKKWYKMCFSTFLSLFVRLIALYFAVYIISRIDSLVDIIDGSYKSGPILKIFVVIGALMFAKQLPKILQGLGIKIEGADKFTLNPFKKFENEAIGGKKILGGAKGFAAGTMVGTAGMLTGAGLGRGVSAMFSGTKAGIQGKKFGDIRKDQVVRNAEMRRARASGSSFLERRGAQISGYFGLPGRLGEIQHDKMDLQNKMDNLEGKKQLLHQELMKPKSEIEKRKRLQESISAMEKRAKSEIEQGNSEVGKEYLRRKAKVDRLTNHGVTVTRAATSEELNSAERKLDTMKKGKMVKRAATETEIAVARQELERVKGSVDGKTVDGKKKIDSAQQKINDLINKGVTEHISFSDEEIEKAQQEYDNLKNNGITETRNATDEELAQATYEMNNWLNDEGMKKYMTDAISGTINDATFSNVYNNGYKANIDELSEDGYQELTDGAEIHSQYGKSKGEVGSKEKEIYEKQRDIEKCDQELSNYKEIMQQLNAQERDAKASVQAVHGTEGGPSRPGSITSVNHTVGYRSGGVGSGIAPAMTGYSTPGRRPGGTGGPGTPPPGNS